MTECTDTDSIPLAAFDSQEKARSSAQESFGGEWNEYDELQIQTKDGSRLWYEVDEVSFNPSVQKLKADWDQMVA